MEYLPGKKLSDKDLQSSKFYVTLAHLLQRIHRGQAFKNSRFDVFKRIGKGIQINKSKFSKHVSLARIERAMTIIRRALLPHPTAATPCHNDLHGENLVFMGTEFKAIDYGNAGVGDPYFDVATMVFIFCLDPVHENILFSAYLGRQPSAVEKAKLYLMKQIVLILRIVAKLRRMTPEEMSLYRTVKAPSFIDLVRKHLKNELGTVKPNRNLKILKALFNEAFKNFESEDFRKAVNVLSKKDI